MKNTQLMSPRVTVVPSDRLIIVNGGPLRFDYSAPEDLHALQWHDGAGHVEFTDHRPNEPLTMEDYTEKVLSYVQLWEAEKARLRDEAEAVEAARLAEYNSEPARFERLRTARDQKIAATDYLLMPDYPLDDAAKEEIRAYRQSLRDVPELNGAPWDGGGEDTPWPQKPEFLCHEQTEA